ncbi:related to DNA repair protein rad9 [Ustilago trichophora]|uniref:Related to DNA repair protein rad9 n=1 Tax=Ustilago trichophora TaxID=86804 RepID=A0A5C3ELZ6_9BASI|nr:related to DNA repair protein rad9 [Ustilago trichophora]
MNALISASDIKTFYSALHCLSRFSETFWLSCSSRNSGQAQIRLSAINPTNSAFCMFAFDPDFFLSVSTSDQKIECQIQLKTILSILRTRGRNVERLSLSLTDNTPTCRFTLTLHCHHSILKTHNLTYSPKRGLLPTADPNPPNFLCLNASTASEWLDHFLSSSRTGEITLLCTPDSCIARSKEEEIPEGRGQIRRSIATEVKIAVEEFKDYCVLEDVKLTFSLREFKATVALAESLGVPLEMNFSDGDEPLFVRLRVESAVAGEFVIATTRGDRTAGTGGGATAGEEGQTRATTAAQQAQAAGIAASVASSSSARQTGSRTTSSSHNRQADTSNTNTSSSSMLSHPAPAATSANRTIPNQSTPLPSNHTLRETNQPPSEQLSVPPHHRCNVPEQGEESDEETQPLFFPGCESQLSLQPTPSSPSAPAPEVTFVQPTPVAMGGDPDEFFAAQASSTQSTSGGGDDAKMASQHPELVGSVGSDSDSDTSQRGGNGRSRKRFKPLF